MADRRVKVTFSAEVQNYKAAMEAAAKSTEAVKKAADDAGKVQEQAGAKADAAAKKAAESAAKHKDALDRVGTAATIGGAAVLAGVGLAVKSYADFDKQMSSVDAATHETAGNMDLLRQAAVDAGADTAFSAAEAAKGIEELAKAGVSTKDILAGGLDGSLALAAAGSLDVGEAAEIAASALTQFKLSGDKVPHVADLLAAGAGKAQGSVQDLGAALNQSGLIASSTGLTIEETTGALAAFASAGLTGSDAGTSFKTMLMSLTPSSKEAAKLMEELGINAYDAQGEFVGMSEYAGILQNALKDMSDEQRNATLKTIFGSDAVRAANVLYEQGAAGINKWEDAVNDAGYAADTAARMQDNLAGDLEKLGGSFDTVLIQSGSGANEVLRGLVQGLEGLVDTVGKVPAPVLAVGTGLAAVVGGAGLVGGALITVIPKIKDTKDALNDLAPAGGRARNALEKVGKAAGVAGGLVAVTTVLAKLAEADYMSKIDTGMGNVNNALQDVAKSSPGAAAGIDALFKDRAGGDLISGVDDLGDALTRTFNKDLAQDFNDASEGVVKFATDFITGGNGVKGSSHILADSFDRIDQSLAEMVSSGNSDDAAKNFDLVAKAAKERGISIEELTTKFPAYSDALKQAEADAKAAGEGGDKAAAGIKAAGDASATAATQAEDIAKALDEVGVNADGSIADLDKFTEALGRAGLLQLSTRDAARAYEGALDTLTEAVTKNGATLDISTEQGRANQAAFDGIASAGLRSAEAMARSGESQSAIQGKLQGTYTDLVRAGVGFGLTAGQADALARKVLGVPKGVSISSWMSDQAKATAEKTKAAVDAIPASKTVGIHVRYTESGTAIRDRAGDAGMSNRVQAYAGGGRLPAFADGGRMPTTGPGTNVTDGFLGVDSAGIPRARVDAGEWIINGNSSNRYNRELAAINAGTFPKLPGFASGGMFSAQHFGNAPYRGGAAPGGVSFGDVTINDQSDPVATFHEFSRRAGQLAP